MIMKPAMTDGRVFTNYESSSLLNAKIQAKFNAADNNQYRTLLQHKTDKVQTELYKLKVFSTDPNSFWNQGA